LAADSSSATLQVIELSRQRQAIDGSLDSRSLRCQVPLRRRGPSAASAARLIECPEETPGFSRGEESAR